MLAVLGGLADVEREILRPTGLRTGTERRNIQALAQTLRVHALKHTTEHQL
jgi:hypothetical protein